MADFSQVAPDGQTAYRPELIRRRGAQTFKTASDEPFDVSLTVPAWMSGQVLPCHSQWMRFDDPPDGPMRSDAYAAAACGGCPVIVACKHHALERESGDFRHRDGVRGGMSAVGRSRLATLLVLRERGECPQGCHGFDPDLVGWQKHDKPYCRARRREGARAGYARGRLRDGARVRNSAGECGECGLAVQNLSRHVNTKHVDPAARVAQVKERGGPHDGVLREVATEWGVNIWTVRRECKAAGVYVAKTPGREVRAS